MAAAVQRCLAPAWVSLALSMYGLRSTSATRRVDNDMDMDVAAVVVTVRVGADQGLVSGNCSAQNRSPSAWALSIVRPWSGPSLGSKDRM